MRGPWLWSRRLVKTAVAATVYPFLAPHTPLVLGYHRVVRHFEHEVRSALQGSLVSCAMLERHLDAVGRRFDFVPLDEIGRSLQGGRRPRRPLAAVTFDDGYRDVYENAFPMLRRKGIPGAVFVVTDLVGTEQEQTHDRLYRLMSTALATASGVAIDAVLATAGLSDAGRARLRHAVSASHLTRGLLTALPRCGVLRAIDGLERLAGPLAPPSPGALPMAWAMLVEMRNGGIAIGSHTRHHVLLGNEKNGVLASEVTGSRRDLERRLGGPIEHFAYPDGSFTKDAVHSVASAGYRYAYTACLHRDQGFPSLTIPRRILWEQSAVDPSGRFSEPILRCQAHGILNGRSTCTRYSHA